jgi:hypothetical protein
MAYWVFNLTPACSHCLHRSLCGLHGTLALPGSLCGLAGLPSAGFTTIEQPTQHSLLLRLLLTVLLLLLLRTG